MRAIAKAHPNIALVKYWGKRNSRLNLPDVGSISITLDGIETLTEVEFDESLKADELLLNDETQPAELARVSEFLDLIRSEASSSLYARIKTNNNFPTGAGLASSASGFAALALAASKAIGLNLSPAELSRLARQGSGSAARSIFGGFVEMQKGNIDDGRDALAHQLYSSEYWDLRVLIAVTDTQKKAVGSTEGMERTRQTSPYYDAWLLSSDDDLQEMREAIAARDFRALGELSEHSALKMHALAMAARPPLIYWNSVTVALMLEVRRLREGGLEAYFTIDAGPQVKVITLPENEEEVASNLRRVPGLKTLFHSRIGQGVHLVETE
ncbi:diphosphomevalonate decarboxylase [Myxococcota bacterium]|nr:diphosphomevalonate decarboxylase [Myxococcota bacterium]